MLKGSDVIHHDASVYLKKIGMNHLDEVVISDLNLNAFNAIKTSLETMLTKLNDTYTSLKLAWTNILNHSDLTEIQVVAFIVIKDIFAWVYLVSTEQITNREIIGIGCNSSEMDRDRYSGNCLVKVEADNGEAGRRKRNGKRFCVEGVTPHGSFY